MYNRIKELRQKYNFTQYQICQKLNISRASYFLYESGKRAIPLHILSKLAKIYNTSIDFIVGDTDEIERYK